MSESSNDAAVGSESWSCGPPLGARFTDDGGIEVRVDAPRAHRIEVALFDAALGASERLRVPLESIVDGRFTITVVPSVLANAGLSDPIYYGLRVWGPNWPFVASWVPGSDAGRIADVDDHGNRMNPNKLLLDPYASSTTNTKTRSDFISSHGNSTATNSAILRNLCSSPTTDGPERSTHNFPKLPEAVNGIACSTRAKMAKSTGGSKRATRRSKSQIRTRFTADRLWASSPVS